MVNDFKTGIEDSGLVVLPSHSAIIPVLIGEAEPALNFAQMLKIREPTLLDRDDGHWYKTKFDKI